MRAHTPPFTRATAKQVYDKTSAIAAAQDAKLDPISDVESKVRTAMQYLYHAQLLLKEAFPSRDGQQGIPAESAYIARLGPNSLPGAALIYQDDALREVLTAEELKGFGIGDVEPRDVANHATTVATSQHPANAEALRMADERTPEDRL